MSSALELRRVSKIRGKGRHAVEVLSDLSLRVHRGQVVLLRGPSGSGKTTLLSVAAGLLQADSGEVRVDGEPLPTSAAQARRFRARKIGFVFQRANLLAGLTVLENVLLAAALAQMNAAEARREARRLLSALGIGHLEARRPDALSGGEEQRAAVARALVHRPAVILADEPTGGLDQASGRHVAMLLAAMASESGVSVLIATHDDRLCSVSTRQVVLLDGRISERAVPAVG
jgi:putative ABC transport system ATP-binding protein